MPRFAFGASVWLFGAGLLLYVTLIVIDRIGDGIRLNLIVFDDNWYFTMLGLALFSIGHYIMARLRF